GDGFTVDAPPVELRHVAQLDAAFEAHHQHGLARKLPHDLRHDHVGALTEDLPEVLDVAPLVDVVELVVEHALELSHDRPHLAEPEHAVHHRHHQTHDAKVTLHQRLDAR